MYLVFAVLLVLLTFLFLRWRNKKHYPMSTNPLLIRPTDPASYRLPEDLRRDWVDLGYFRAFRLRSKQGVKYWGPVLCCGGFEGSPDYPRAVNLAHLGYDVFAFFYFGMEGQQPYASRVPLDFFHEFLDWYQQEEGEGPLTLIGTSKGAELSLALACHYPEISQLILIAPTMYSFFSLHPRKEEASWTYGGQDLPYISRRPLNVLWHFLCGWSALTAKPARIFPIYHRLAHSSSDRPLARFPVEKLQCRLLLFAGEEDAIWPSADMARELAKQKPINTRLYTFPGVGHIFYRKTWFSGQGTQLMNGGTTEANLEAAQILWTTLSEALPQHHPRKENACTQSSVR